MQSDAENFFRFGVIIDAQVLALAVAGVEIDIPTGEAGDLSEGGSKKKGHKQRNAERIVRGHGFPRQWLGASQKEI